MSLLGVRPGRPGGVERGDLLTLQHTDALLDDLNVESAAGFYFFHHCLLCCAALWGREKGLDVGKSVARNDMTSGRSNAMPLLLRMFQA